MAQIYWEDQESGFCGVHCTNNLLQGPYFTEVEFSTIALDMDEAEKKIMAEKGTETRDFLQYMAQDSENVNAGGNFSIQVLEKAMEIMGLKIAPFKITPTADPTALDAIVCNLENHWFSLRKIGGNWFNLNSLHKDGPSPISTFYLSAFLKQLQDEKYSIFAVTGTFPSTGQTLHGRGKWFSAASLLAASRRPSDPPQRPGAVTRAVSSIMNRINGGTITENDADLQRVLEQSRREANARQNQNPSQRPRNGSRLVRQTSDDDPELQRVLALSRKER